MREEYKQAVLLRRSGGQKPLSARRMAGLTLVELMIAVALGLILTTGVINAFLTHKQGSYQDEQVATVQENARFALYTLKRDLSMAAYTAGVNLDAATYNAEEAKNCGAGWATALFTVVEEIDPLGNKVKSLVRNGIDFINNAATATNQFCANGDVQDETDILVVRRGADDFTRRYGDSINGRKANGDRLYLADGGISNGSTDATVDTKATVMEYIAKSYYVRNYTEEADDGEPCLMLNALAAGGDMATDCLVPGVEDLQIIWGVDTSAEPDQVPNGYTDTPDATAPLSQVVSAQVYILVRSSGTIPGYTDTKTYTVGNHAVDPPDDGYYRRVFSTSVRIPNHYLAKPGLAAGE